MIALFLHLLVLGARTGTFVRMFPIFEPIADNASVITPIALSLALFTVPMYVGGPVWDRTAAMSIGYFVIFGQEVVIGALLAVVLGIPLKISTSLGQLIDNARGAPIDSSQSPIARAPSSPIETLLQMVITLAVFEAGLDHEVLDVVFHTHAALPVGAALPEAGPAAVLSGLSGLRYLMFRLLPLFVLLLLIDFGVNALGKRISGIDSQVVTGAAKTAIVLAVIFELAYMLLHPERLAELQELYHAGGFDLLPFDRGG